MIILIINSLLDKLEEELKLRNFSKKTVRSYLFVVKQFLEYSKGKELNEKILRSYILKNPEKQEPSTASHSLSILSFFFEKILRKKINLPHPKRNKKILEILTPEEIKRLIGSTSNIKHKLILQILYGCELRVSEVINLKKEGF